MKKDKRFFGEIYRSIWEELTVPGKILLFIPGLLYAVLGHLLFKRGED